MKLGIIASTLVVAGTLLVAPTAHAATTPAVVTATATPPPVEPVVEQDDTMGMSPMGTDKFGIIDMKAPDGPITMAKGAGGRSSASGCARFWVEKRVNNLLGSEAFKLRVWTDACWNRASHLVWHVTTGRTILYVGSTWKYAGVISSDRRYYTWGGSSKGGYHHYELVGFDNCVVKWGCLGSHNVRMTINVHSNGTYNWYTDGDTNG